MQLSTSDMETLRAVCRDAWSLRLLPGRSGNASLRLDQGNIVVTRSGAAKGRLTDRDFCLVDGAGRLLEGERPSTETGMHLAIYRTLPEVSAVLHTHPRNMLALTLCLDKENFLHLPLFEAREKRARLGFAPALAPGSEELARAVADAARDHEAVWMEAHGLCCRGKTLDEALCLSEELEHLAAVQLGTHSISTAFSK
jgi:L-fuculose-phosphate aldolase